MFGVVRIGFGAAICFSWLTVTGDCCRSGGVFKRGTPTTRVSLQQLRLCYTGKHSGNKYALSKFTDLYFQGSVPGMTW